MKEEHSKIQLETQQLSGWYFFPAIGSNERGLFSGWNVAVVVAVAVAVVVVAVAVVDAVVGVAVVVVDAVAVVTALLSNGFLAVKHFP